MPKDKLRNQAEESLGQNPEMLKEISSEDIDLLIHKLQVHQIELEMQNDELRRAQVELEESRSKYVNLYDYCPIGYFTLSNKGLIIGANLTGASLLGAERGHFLNRRFSQFVAPDSQDLYYMHLKQVLEAKAKKTVELKLQKRDGTTFCGQLESIAGEDDLGNFNEIRVSLTDITVRKESEV